MAVIGILYLLLSIIAFSRRDFFKYLLVITMIIGAFSQAYGVQIVAISLGGTSIYVSDIPVILMVFYILRNPIIPKSKTTFLWFVAFSMVVLSAFIGFAEFGVNLYYLSDIRLFLSLVIPFIYFYSQETCLTPRFMKFLQRAMFLMVSYCYIAWIFYAITGISLAGNDTGGGLRVLGSNATIYLAIYTLYQMYVYFFLNKYTYKLWQILYNIVAIVVLQHNSVWAAFAVGYIVMLFIVKRQDTNSIIGKMKLWKLTLCIAVLCLVCIYIFQKSYLVENLLSSFEKYSESQTGEGTIGDRQRIWQEYINSLNGIEWLIGKPMGTGWFVESKYGGLALSPTHNAYVQGLMRIGLIGDIAIFGMLIIASLQAYAKRNYAIIVVVITSMVYIYAYMFSMELACIWGLIIGILNGNIWIEEGIIDEQV